MSHLFLRDSRFWSFLSSVDSDLAQKAKDDRCPLCRSVLHSARYPRKPRGAPDALPPDYQWRLSFCCSRDGCRRRRTPPSVRFLGAKVYLGLVVILVTAMRQGPSPRGSEVLKQRFGADRRTIARWQTFWRELFPTSAFWRVARARVAGETDSSLLPRSLLEVFRAHAATFREALWDLLRFLSPITVTGGLDLQAP